MSREEPFFRKCCFCIPLKSCLQTWSVIKSILDISISVFFTLMIILLTDLHIYRFSLDKFGLPHAMFISIMLLLVDSVFMVVLSIGLWTNNLRGLRVFYFYSIYMVIAGAVFLIGMVVYGIVVAEMNKYDSVLFWVLVVCGFINTALDVCIILTLKSEIIKLRNKQQYEFYKMPSLNNEEEPAEPFQVDEEYLDD